MSDFKQLHTLLSALPVAAVAPEIVQTVKEGIVTVLSSDTGSGKTLLATTALADAIDHQVVVCVPRRFLAINAAETVAELSGTVVGEAVGYAIGVRGGESSFFTPETKLLFVTYGYALRAGILNSGKTIVLDEVHEASMDISIARAVLHYRLKWGEQVHVLEMSATMNAEKQANYWRGAHPAKVYQVDGATHPCVRYQVGNERILIADTAIDMLRNHGRKGIAIFRPGVGDVHRTAEEVRDAADKILKDAAADARKNLPKSAKNQSILAEIREAQQKTGLLGLEISVIYGDMDAEERAVATVPPKGDHPKIIVGTNVLESGINLPWLDAGISCGTGKEKVELRESGASALVLIDLPQWRLTQQEGRVKRFKPGMFALHSDLAWEARDLETRPEIERLSLADLVMHCASMDLDPTKLSFDAPVELNRLKEARQKLIHLGLIRQDWTLTQAGKYAVRFPVGAEGGAMLWRAKEMDILDAAIPLIAMVEIGTLREDQRASHRQDSTSDYIDSMKAFQNLNKAKEEWLKERIISEQNINIKRFAEAQDLIEELRARHSAVQLTPKQVPFNALRDVLMTGQVERLFYRVAVGAYASLLTGEVDGIARNTCLRQEPMLLSGQLRTIIPQNGRPFTVIENVTAYPEEVFLNVARDNPQCFSAPRLAKRNKGQCMVVAFEKHEVYVPRPKHLHPHSASQPQREDR